MTLLLKFGITALVSLTAALGEFFCDNKNELYPNLSCKAKKQLGVGYTISKVTSKLTDGVLGNMVTKFLEKIGWANMDASEGLSTYCVDLVELAKQGKIREVVGREEELKQAIAALTAGRCPCFIGKAGVGKSAIAEGLAVKIAKGEVPDKLKDKKIWLLNYPKLRAGNGFSTDYVSRIKGLVESLTADKNNILFFDEIHLISPISDYFKPAMAKGNAEGGLLVMGATTIDEYNKYIIQDAALHRRFSHIIVQEASKDETKIILSGLKKDVESVYKLTFSDEVYDEIIRLSEQVLTSEYFPAKSINLVNEVASYCEMLGKDVMTIQDVREYLSMKKKIPIEKLADGAKKLIAKEENKEQSK